MVTTRRWRAQPGGDGRSGLAMAWRRKGEEQARMVDGGGVSQGVWARGLCKGLRPGVKRRQHEEEEDED